MSTEVLSLVAHVVGNSTVAGRATVERAFRRQWKFCHSAGLSDSCGSVCGSINDLKPIQSTRWTRATIAGRCHPVQMIKTEELEVMSPVNMFRKLVLIVILLVPGVAQAAQNQDADSRVGKRIIVTKAGAEMKTPQATVWRAYPGEVYEINLVNGEWLWIQERGGWLWEKEAVLFDKAIAVTSDRLAKSPTAEAYHVRGVVFVAHQQYDRAIQDFTTSLEKSPRNAGVLNNRGQCHYYLKNYPAAVSDFSEATRVDPKHFLAFNNRALAHIAQKKFDKARADVKKALALNPKYPEALLNRGLINAKTGKPDQAISDYSAAIKIHPKYIAAFGNRAFTYRSQGRYQEAIADLRAAIKLAPKNFELVNDLAFTLATAKDDKVRDGAEAVALAEQANSMIGEEHWNTLDTLAVARAAVNDFNGATEAVDRAIAVAPESEVASLKAHRDLFAAETPVLE